MERNLDESVQWPVTSVHDPNRTNITTGGRSSSNGETSNEMNKPTRMRRVRPGVLFHANKRPINSHEKLEHRDEADSDDVDNILIQLVRNVAWAKSRLKAKNSVNNSPSKSYSKDQEVSTESPRSDVSVKSFEDSYALTSSEVFEDVLRKLQRLGDRGRSVLRRLNDKMGDTLPNIKDGIGHEGFKMLRNIIHEMIRERDAGNSNRSEEILERRRRAITLASASLQESLNVHAEDEDAATEEVSDALN